jgi:SNF2 family DNA or RNA helicase
MTPIAPGAHILLRDAVWRVVRIDRTSTGTSAWRCVGVSEIVRDQDAIFLEEFEDPKEVTVLDPRETKLERDKSTQHRAGLLYIESRLREVPPPPDDVLYVGHRAAMDVLDFQLEPTARALDKPRARILIADAVGLGKTLEAGILLSELIRRGKARRILVAATKAMLTQFQKEMWGRFTIPLVRLDSIGLQRIRAEIPTHHNPFYYFDRVIISIDTLKQNNWFRHHVEQAKWDVIVIDEAHNVATRGANRSQRAQIADMLARNCDHLVLLSATPHDGRAESFASLMNMLDPTAITDPSNYTKDEIRGLYVRRFKKDVKEELAKHIPERKILKARARASAAEEAAFEALGALALTRIDQHAHGGMLFKTTLEKALFSSPRACLQTIRNRINTIQRDAKRAGAYAADVESLVGLAGVVESITIEDFSRYQKLLEVIRKSFKWKPKDKADRLVIFTERRETLDFLAENLVADLELKDGQAEILHGGLPDHEQMRIVEAFGQEKAKVRLLLATDVASEGLNLHYLCHRMIHFDVPWSLMVFQQRNGRIDRYGQEHEPRIVYMFTDAEDERVKGDQRILELLVEKSEQAEINIGDPSAFMNVYDVEQEELETAKAIEKGLTAEEFEEHLDAQLVDPFALILQDAADMRTSGSRRGELTSLFRSDLEYFTTVTARPTAPPPPGRAGPGRRGQALVHGKFQKTIRGDLGATALDGGGGTHRRRRMAEKWPIARGFLA